MSNRRVFLVMAALALSTPLFAQDGEGPEAFSMIIGPRIGGSWIATSQQEFAAKVEKIYPPGSYFNAMTLFGVTVEQRILLGNTRSHFAFQEVVLIGGLEQGIALPEAAVLIGYRDYFGLEFGIGPILYLQGIGVVAAAGFTFSFNGVFVPVDLSVVIPGANRPASIAVTTGFNFEISRQEPEFRKATAPQRPETPSEPVGNP